MKKKIATFDGENDWLSNFYYSPFTYEGVTYPTVEHGFQALKTDDPDWKAQIIGAKTAGQAKRLGRQCPRRADWNKERVGVMMRLLHAKFHSESVSQGQARLHGHRRTSRG
jgi:ribA/ribD-fused uncharacterized protein